MMYLIGFVWLVAESSANDFTRENKRTTIYPSDILDALRWGGLVACY